MGGETSRIAGAPDTTVELGFEASSSTLERTLRLGAFLCFVGHGAFGIITKEAWVPYFAVVGIGRDMAYQLMPLIGALDIGMGALMLFIPLPVVGYWMLLWTLWTAALRPLAGEPFWEMLERAGNFGVPAAILILMVPPRTLRERFGLMRFREFSTEVLAAERRMLVLTVALLMLGHGALGVMSKPGLVTNYASVFPPDLAADLTPWIGCFEIALAALVVVWQAPAFLLFIAAWKVATEALFLTAGSRIWEWIERGGSYAAPIALAIVVIATRSMGSESIDPDVRAH